MKKIEGIYKMGISITIIIFLFGVKSCSTQTCSPLENKIKEICITPDTLYHIPLNSLLDFKWDELYILSGPRSPEEIEEITGIKYNKIIKDHYRQLFFVKDGKLVQEYTSNCNGISLKIGVGYMKYTNSSIINIRTELHEGKWLYLRSLPLDSSY